MDYIGGWITLVDGLHWWRIRDYLAVKRCESRMSGELAGWLAGITGLQDYRITGLPGCCICYFCPRTFQEVLVTLLLQDCCVVVFVIFVLEYSRRFSFCVSRRYKICARP